ncbi:MAG TPA: hypothetical protein VGX28_09580 [Frankiaceae bacterium]|jgi:hypothetical protein|nr:hypothetical protein [Frankiaceae bacterium]
MSVVVEELRGRLAAAPGSGLPAGRELLPVRSPLDSLFPGGGLARGSVVAVEGSVWLALALVAEASANGSWCAAVGVRDLNPAAAAETGIDLTRLVIVDTRGQLATAVAALLDGVDVVVVQPDARSLRPAEARRLAARARERRSAILAVGGWPDACDLTVRLAESRWLGLTPDGYGRLTERRCRVAASGRGAAARERRAHVTFPLHRVDPRPDPRPRPRAVRPA